MRSGIQASESNTEVKERDKSTLTRRYWLVLIASMLMGAAGCSGSKQDGFKPGDTRVTIARPDSNGNEIGLKREKVDIPPGGDPVQAALVKLFETSEDKDKPSAIPKGVRLLDVKVLAGIATVNVSKEFNELRAHGSTSESLAEGALRTTLAQFPDIQKMLLLVEGKPFESDHADWSEPIPVRESTSAAGGAP